MATKMMSAISIVRRHRVNSMRGAEALIGHDREGKLTILVRRTEAATTVVWRSVMGWLCAVGGWLGVGLWYLQVLAGTRPSAHILGVLCCLILSQLGRVLLQRPASAAAKKVQERYHRSQPYSPPPSMLCEWIVTW